MSVRLSMCNYDPASFTQDIRNSAYQLPALAQRYLHRARALRLEPVNEDAQARLRRGVQWFVASMAYAIRPRTDEQRSTVLTRVLMTDKALNAIMHTATVEETFIPDDWISMFALLTDELSFKDHGALVVQIFEPFIPWMDVRPPAVISAIPPPEAASLAASADSESAKHPPPPLFLPSPGLGISEFPIRPKRARSVSVSPSTEARISKRIKIGAGERVQSPTPCEAVADADVPELTIVPPTPPFVLISPPTDKVAVAVVSHLSPSPSDLDPPIALAPAVWRVSSSSPLLASRVSRFSSPDVYNAGSSACSVAIRAPGPGPCSRTPTRLSLPCERRKQERERERKSAFSSSSKGKFTPTTRNSGSGSGSGSGYGYGIDRSAAGATLGASGKDSFDLNNHAGSSTAIRAPGPHSRTPMRLSPPCERRKEQKSTFSSSSRSKFTPTTRNIGSNSGSGSGIDRSATGATLGASGKDSLSNKKSLVTAKADATRKVVPGFVPSRTVGSSAGSALFGVGEDVGLGSKLDLSSKHVGSSESERSSKPANSSKSVPSSKKSTERNNDEKTSVTSVDFSDESVLCRKSGIVNTEKFVPSRRRRESVTYSYSKKVDVPGTPQPNCMNLQRRLVIISPPPKQQVKSMRRT